MKALSKVAFELWNKIFLSFLKTNIIGEMDGLALSSHPSVTNWHGPNSCHTHSSELNLTLKQSSLKSFHTDLPVYRPSPCCSLPGRCLTVYKAMQLSGCHAAWKYQPNCLPVPSVLMSKIYPWKAESKTNRDCHYHRGENLGLSKRCALNRMQEFFRAFAVSGDGTLIPEQTEPLCKQKE